jgi:hypothetical protein
MNNETLKLRVAIVGAAVLLTSCGAPSQAVVPPAGISPSEPTGPTKEHDLLYVSNSNGTVSVFRYWQHTLVTVLTKFTQPMGECADQAGNVYITDYQTSIVSEYAHGGTKPIKSFKESPYLPDACSVAPTSNNLAVANNPYGYYSKGNIAVYPHGTGKPKVYGTPTNDHFTSCAYDDRGDLFATSTFGYLSFYTEFYYLPKGGSQLILMDLSAPGQSSGWEYVQGVAFDGKYWIVVSFNRVYRFTINIKAKYVDTITLSGGYGDVGDVKLYRTTPKSLGVQIVGGASNGSAKSEVEYWKYPAGGYPIATITKDLDQPNGVAISLAPQ